ncbi:hypothetical protein ACHAWO_000353 [Cyclotella atomus]|uniref:Uncharacterized protein n=1 Tax=Cyclotella atomus TaxID=382360 RepID=A0ABD3PIW2_9STRA
MRSLVYNSTRGLTGIWCFFASARIFPNSWEGLSDLTDSFIRTTKWSNALRGERMRSIALGLIAGDFGVEGISLVTIVSKEPFSLANPPLNHLAPRHVAVSTEPPKHSLPTSPCSCSQHPPPLPTWQSSPNSI